MPDSQTLKFQGEKTAMNGTTHYCTVVDPETGNQYHFSLNGDNKACPSTVGATDTEGLTAACERVEAEGYTIELTGMQPAGFEY